MTGLAATAIVILKHVPPPKAAPLSGWPGTAAGLTAIGACVVLGMFAPRLIPRRWNRAHPWLHRLLAALMYCGACALLVTPVGQGAVRGIAAAFGLLGGVSTGLGHAAVVIAALFLLLTVALALTTEPHPRAIWYAFGLVIVLALVPGGWLHSLLAATSGPGRLAASAVASWMGGS